MGLSNSLYASISGLNTMGSGMSVLGDNVSNVNTVAFKSSRATFQDVLSQNVATASGTAQVGRGVTMTTIDGLFAQGSFESTSTATDLAIGGQGFFMLRSTESAAADMYTRAGEFRFDKEGYLVNPTGNFVQGWTIDEETGDIQGTIGDINIGKTTPPVETTAIQVIANVDSRVVNETNETRLFDAWNGTNAAQAVPTDPIDAGSYEYTTAIKIYDSKGASHDVTVYFDRTTEDNQWEFLVACDPQEDKRVLSDGLDVAGNLDGTNDEISIYAPDTTYNFESHKGAGALLYGVIDFSTSGAIDNIWAWNVPPDGEVDPASNTNRIVLGNTDQYYSFEANFTGATTNQIIDLNLGAIYNGQSTDISQILVSDGGAFANSGGTNYITKETLWNSVYDSTSLQMATGDAFYFAGYDNDGSYVEGSYVVSGTDKVQALLDQIDNAFGCTTTIDAEGRLRMTDKTGGDSGMYVTRFSTISASGARPFGGTTTPSGQNPVVVQTTEYMYQTGTTTPVTSLATLLTAIDDSTGATTIAATDNFTFTGTTPGGVAVNQVFDVDNGGAGVQTVADLLNFIEDAFDDNTINGSNLTNREVSAILQPDGRIAVFSNVPGLTNLSVIPSAGSVSGATPFGAAATPYTTYAETNTLINVTTSKKQIISDGRAVNTATGLEPTINEDTDWTNVYDVGTNAVAVGDTFTFTGSRGDGTGVTAAVFTVAASGDTTTDTFGPPLTAATGTVRDLLTWLEDKFNAEASIDGAGRLVLTDRTAADVAGTYADQLAITNIAYSGAANPFGEGGFNEVPADVSGEDGSRMGDTVSINFSTEALSTTQYANSSTTIFQDQDGFAAGFLQSVSVDTAGVITGNYSNGQVLEKAQVALASFNNLAGLNKEGGNVFRETTESGAPVTGAPGTNGLGSISPNSLEQSNVDLGTEFVKLITTQRGFQANSKIITTTDEMLADLINIKR